MRQCVAVDKAWFGRRELWLVCRSPFGHEGAHHDPKHKGHYWVETFRAFEFEVGRPRKMPTAKKVMLCKRCEKEVRTDGATDACVCKQTGNSGRQKVMFAEDREKIARAEALSEMEQDLAWLMELWAKQEAEDQYWGEW